MPKLEIEVLPRNIYCLKFQVLFHDLVLFRNLGSQRSTSVESAGGRDIRGGQGECKNMSGFGNIINSALIGWPVQSLWPV